MKTLKPLLFYMVALSVLFPIPSFAGAICEGDFVCKLQLSFLAYSTWALYIAPFTFLLGLLLARKAAYKTSGKVLMWVSGAILIVWAIFFSYQYIQRQQIDAQNKELVATSVPQLYIPNENLLSNEASWKGRFLFNNYVENYGKPESLRPFVVEFLPVYRGTNNIYLKDPITLNYRELPYNEASALGTKCPKEYVYDGKTYAESFTEECQIVAYFNENIPIYESKPDPMFARVFSARINDTIVVVRSHLRYADHSVVTQEQIISYFENLSLISAEDFIKRFGFDY